MTRPLRIGYLVPQFPGQSHLVFWREIRALESMGHEVHILSTRKPPSGLIAHDWSDDAMARTIYLGRPHPGMAAAALIRLAPRGLPFWTAQEGARFGRDAALSLSASEALLAYTWKARLDHVHSLSCGRTALIAAFARRAGGVPFSLTLHRPLAASGPGQRFKWRDAAFARVVSRQLLDEVHESLSGALPARITLRPLGVDTDILQRGAAYMPPDRAQPARLFSCARLAPEKGHQDVLTAMRQLLDQGVDVRLEIAGDDGGSGYRQTLEALLRKLHLQDHVKLLGAIDSGAVRHKLEEAHLFVLASWHEPLGIACMEAMAMGVPVITTEAGGVPELIENGRTGRLVTPAKPVELARAIRDLAADPDLMRAFSGAGRAHVETHFRAAAGAGMLAGEIARSLCDAPRS